MYSQTPRTSTYQTLPNSVCIFNQFEESDYIHWKTSKQDSLLGNFLQYGYAHRLWRFGLIRQSHTNKLIRRYHVPGGHTQLFNGHASQANPHLWRHGNQHAKLYYVATERKDAEEKMKVRRWKNNDVERKKSGREKREKRKKPKKKEKMVKKRTMKKEKRKKKKEKEKEKRKWKRKGMNEWMNWTFRIEIPSLIVVS
jgi:hypothetical protein